MTKVVITFPDGKTKEFDKGVTGAEIARSIGRKLVEDALAIQVDGKLLDLYRKIDQDSKIKIVTFKDKEGVDIFRHSTAHVLAYAIQQLYPNAKNTIGPPVDEGFYYDFDDLDIKQDDLPKIEKKMEEIAQQGLTYERKELNLDEVKKIFSRNKYKIEMASEFQEVGQKLTVYTMGEDFIDLCRGPHTPNTKIIKAIKLTKLAGAYWRGDAKNKQLTRIYGVSFPTKKELEEFLKQQEEAAKRDHKKIGEQLDLYMISESIGKGLPLWLPKGEIIKKQIENYAVDTEDNAGYVRVSTPHLAKEELFVQSGHLPHYADSMYPSMVMDDGKYRLKAMNCPLHHVIYNHKKRSYRELPLRIAEYGTVYRNELSGALSGLLRVRMLSMNDAHIYCTKEQIRQEVQSCLEMIKKYYKIFGLENYYFRLSLWNPENGSKYIDEPENWIYAEEQLRKTLKELDIPFTEAKDEAAFYGPKIDIQFRTVTGREETMSTVQLDFAAKKRFKLEYADKNGEQNNEVFVIHRAPLSTHERFTAFIIEHYAGNFPLWLSPEQIRIVPVSDKFNEYAHMIAKKFKEHGFRMHVDERSEGVSKKIREAQLDKVNYAIVVGEKEQESKQLTIRTRDGKLHVLENEKFLKELLIERDEKLISSMLSK